MTASLMMYTRPELAVAHARLWACFREGIGVRGIPSPTEM